MSDAQAVAGMDRLPWLADEPRPRPKQGARELTAVAAAATLLVAAASYWIGSNSRDEPAGSPQPRARTATIQLPEPRQVQPAQPQVKIAPAPEVEPVVAPPMPIIDQPPPVKRVKAPAVTAAPAPEAKPAEAAEQPAKVDPLQPWPARVVDGASGRLVRIGAFATARQAKKGWWAIVRMNPALKRLPALVVPVQSLRNGRIYYRLQMGTTSQAHSTVLCQRMRMIAQSCVVIGVAEAVEAGQ